MGLHFLLIKTYHQNNNQTKTMNFDLTKIKLFASKEERAARAHKDFLEDTKYGDPKQELSGLYTASKSLLIFASIVTGISTAYFVFTVLSSKVSELTSGNQALYVASMILLALVAIGLSYFTEKALRGVWKPFWKEAFISKGKSVDGVLLIGGIFFSAIIISMAIVGIFIVADSEAPVVHESAVATNEATNKLIAAKDVEIAKIQACKVKGGYCYQKNLTPKGVARIEALQAEKAQLLANGSKTLDITSANNGIKTLTRAEKVSKAQRYLGGLTIGMEILKFLIFIFWGHRSNKLNSWANGGRQQQGGGQRQVIDDDEEDVKKKFNPHHFSQPLR